MIQINLGRWVVTNYASWNLVRKLIFNSHIGEGNFLKLDAVYHVYVWILIRYYQKEDKEEDEEIIDILGLLIS